MTGERILVIKLGAMGDFLQAAGPFAAIRAHHGRAAVTLLTTRPFVEFARQSPWFDEVWEDEKPRSLSGWLALRRRLRDGGFNRIYDLQTSDRSSWYFHLMGPGRRPEWSGIARGCSHPHANPRRDFMHTIERQAEQLAMAGIDKVEPADFSWVASDIGRFTIAAPFALLVPGGSPHRPDKRWPEENFLRLARELAGRGLTPVLLGGAAESAILERMAAACPEARDLGGKTSLADLLALAGKAALAVGNDTGPMHAAALAGTPSLVLYSSASDPALCGQRGPAVTILRKPSLADLGVEAVLEAADPLLAATRCHGSFSLF